MKFSVVSFSSAGNGVSAISSDGINWTTGTMPSSSIWSNIAYGNGTFVIVSKLSSSNVAATLP